MITHNFALTTHLELHWTRRASQVLFLFSITFKRHCQKFDLGVDDVTTPRHLTASLRFDDTFSVFDTTPAGVRKSVVSL